MNNGDSINMIAYNIQRSDLTWQVE